jgi:hypothetical protein
MFEKFIVFICKSNFLMMLRLVQDVLATIYHHRSLKNDAIFFELKLNK